MSRTLRIIRRVFITLSAAVLSLAIITYLYMQRSEFGKAPSGARLERIKKSPNYKNGQFQNYHNTPTFGEGYSLSTEVYRTFFRHNPRKRPADTLPSVKTDLKKLPPDSNLLVWFGHSSYYLQVDRKRFVIDPVFSGNASPVPGSNPAFKGTSVYSAADIPEIDYLIISHDHYDHLDYETVRSLQSKVKTVICGLGVGAHFEHWGYRSDQIQERDWYETLVVGDRFRLHITPARHQSGRTFKSNNTLWVSYALEAPSMKIYLGGDSGYDIHFKEIGKKYGPFDLAILENGQYNKAYPYIHMAPAETIQAARNLRAKRLFPVHNSKFALGRHPWDEPLIRITELSRAAHLLIITPMIGQVVHFDDDNQSYSQWWQGLQ